MLSLEVRGVRKSFGSNPILHGIDLNIAAGEFLVLVGPSGCGKSTLLRLIAGLERLDHGEILINGKVVNDVEAQDREVGMVFQSYALYPQMTVEENLSFGLRMKKVPAGEIAKRVSEVAATLRIEHLLQRKPKELSGGQRQRVALGRALARRAPVLLFDEPLSNLDAHLRNQMRLEIKHLQRQMGSTVIYVTHDQIEATTLGDRIAVLNKGNLEQVDRPERIYQHPNNEFVASFIGSPEINLLHGALAKGAGGDWAWRGTANWAITGLISSNQDSEKVTAGVRPEDWRVLDQAPDGYGTGLSGKIELIESVGASQVCYVQTPAGLVRLVAPPSRRMRVGNSVQLTVDPDQVHFFASETGRRLDIGTAQ